MGPLPKVDKSVYLFRLYNVDRFVYPNSESTIDFKKLRKNMLNTSNPLPSNAKQKILFAAHDLFYSKGIRATGIDLVIAQAKVTKTTFYRHFPSKNRLILAYLDYRHQIWFDWFEHHIQSNPSLIEGIGCALSEWFTQDDFRGCAFINSLSEIATELPEVKTKVSQHKRDVVCMIMQKLPSPEDTVDNLPKAQAIVMAIDGAIVRVQSGEDKQHTIELLRKTLSLFTTN